jgi:hypothetical protein
VGRCRTDRVSGTARPCVHLSLSPTGLDIAPPCSTSRLTALLYLLVFVFKPPPFPFSWVRSSESCASNAQPLAECSQRKARHRSRATRHRPIRRNLRTLFFGQECVTVTDDRTCLRCFHVHASGAAWQGFFLVGKALHSGVWTWRSDHASDCMHERFLASTRARGALLVQQDGIESCRKF